MHGCNGVIWRLTVYRAVYSCNCLMFVCSLQGSTERVRTFVEATVSVLTTDDFRMHFRMSRSCFERLAQRLARTDEFTVSSRHGGRSPIPIDKALLISLWTLATPDSYRSISNLFDVPKSSVLMCLRRVCRASIASVCKEIVRFPENEDDIKSNEDRFFNVRGLSRVLGAIDGCHIPIKAPSHEPAAYVNRKGFHSVVLQAVVDSRMFFLDCYAGWPGSVHDARVFRNSPLFSYGEKVCRPGKFIVGDAAYPLLQWLLVPYRDNGRLTHVQKNFNFVHSSTRCTVERAFALLKGRWRRLKYLDMKHMQDIAEVVMTCCVFHNICLQNDKDTELFLPPDNDNDSEGAGVHSYGDQYDINANKIRDDIAETLTNV